MDNDAPHFSAEALFQVHQDALQWQWVAGHASPDRRFDPAVLQQAQSAADLVGFLNYIHPYRVQVMSWREVEYLSDASTDDASRRIARIVTLDPPAIVVADDRLPPPALIAMCDRAEIPLFTTASNAGHVIDILRSWLGQIFAKRTSVHGVMLDILGVGVLLTGESGLGKSELGLELISRGHGLVADDVVEVQRVSQTSLEARCPDLLQNLLEVRGIGLLDIKAIFGETAVRRKMRVKLIVHLVRRETLEREFERIPHEPLVQEILSIPVRKVVVAVDAGRNLAVLVEAAVRNHILQLRGIDTYQDFLRRHHEAMQQGQSEN
ncbi:HPr(Ser) kinase/phosphatase [Amphibiibacter pelophylacis]|uniref:HPr(Ser) kinase/phosphatase n=1 Tax=Amphibiibacter pelophylacis TaxID=1799477 RepID=A0ACC6P207_9BURK